MMEEDSNHTPFSLRKPADRDPESREFTKVAPSGEGAETVEGQRFRLKRA